MSNEIKEIQRLLGVKDDGIWGPKTQAALDALIHPTDLHAAIASSFADPKDVVAFRRAKERGLSDLEAFKVGDNGIGCWGDDVTEGTGPSCALPPEKMEAQYGTVAAAKHMKVEVIRDSKSVVCILKDRMPHEANIKNGAGIDLNPDAVRALGLEPPIMAPVIWKWI